MDKMEEILGLFPPHISASTITLWEEEKKGGKQTVSEKGGRAGSQTAMKKANETVAPKR